MHLSIVMIGSVKKQSCEYELAESYLRKLPWKVALEYGKPSTQQDISKRSQQEAAWLQKYAKGTTYLLDERGKALTSKAFTTLVTRSMAEAPPLTFLIGGAYGLDASLRSQYPSLSFGAMTWPHRLVLPMLCEQLYRASTIDSGHPYHK